MTFNRRETLSALPAGLFVTACAGTSGPQRTPQAPVTPLKVGRIAYYSYGSGTPSLFLHGLGMNAYFWAGQLSGLANQRKCIAIDLMAHGHSEISASQDVSFTAQAEMAWTVLILWVMTAAAPLHKL